MVRACLHCSGRENNDSEIYLEIVGIAPRLEPLAVAVEGLGYERCFHAKDRAWAQLAGTTSIS